MLWGSAYMLWGSDCMLRGSASNAVHEQQYPAQAELDWLLYWKGVTPAGRLHGVLHSYLRCAKHSGHGTASVLKSIDRFLSGWVCN